MKKIVEGKNLQRKVAKAISFCLKHQYGETYSVPLLYDGCYADPIRMWAEFRFVWNYTDHRIRMKIRKETGNIKYPFKTVSIDEQSIDTVNKLTKWACALIKAR